MCSWVYNVKLWCLTNTCSDIQQSASSNYGHNPLANIHSPGSQVCLCFFNLLQAKSIHTAPAAYALQWVPHAPHTHASHTHAPHTHASHTHAPHTHAPHTHAPHTHAPHTHAPHTHASHTITTALWRHMHIHCPPVARQAVRGEMEGVASTSCSSVQCMSGTRKQA